MHKQMQHLMDDGALHILNPLFIFCQGVFSCLLVFDISIPFIYFKEIPHVDTHHIAVIRIVIKP